MKTLKHTLPKKTLSETSKEIRDTQYVFMIENSGFSKAKVRKSNPIQIISTAWRKAKRLNEQIGKVMD